MHRGKKVKPSAGVRLAVLMGLLILVSGSTCMVNAKEKRTVKVGVAPIEGYSTVDAGGERSGVIIDYLEEIAKYTGWEYEYIDTDRDKLVDDFLEGKFELVGGSYYAPELEEYFAYPQYSTGISKARLVALTDNQEIVSGNLQTINGKVIGVYQNAVRNIASLQNFLTVNGLECTLKYYDNQERENGILYQHLRSGEIDLLLCSVGVDEVDCITVTTFDTQPHYIVTTPENQELLEELNGALQKIAESRPNFAQECYEKNFESVEVEPVQLSQEERDYIAQKKELKVAMPRQWHPMCCPYEGGASHKGIAPEILCFISEYSGLQMNCIYTDNYIEAIELVKNGEADVLGFYLGEENQNREDGLIFTQKYIALSDAIARDRSVSYPASGLSCGVVRGRTVPEWLSDYRMVYYDSIDQALADVNGGKLDCCYGVSAMLEAQIQKNYYTNIVISVPENTRVDICFAIGESVERELLTILNKAINSLPAESLEEITDRNVISEGISNITLRDLLYSHPQASVLVVGAFCACIIGVLLWMTHMRVRTVVMKAELMKAEAESRARGEFLSRMSHEIRTPMNAIVGIADLTGRRKDLPPEVAKNLSKIRSSCRYLLNLINDILDMSRIDNNMLTIAKEPFSLTALLDGLKTMMELEATNHGLGLVINKEVTHSELLGDEIRLKQVLTNLLSNAVKFTPSGGFVTLEVRETDADEEGASFIFSVTDNGQGIALENQKKIFNAFERGDESNQIQGTGLGLPISNAIVRLMGDELKLESELGKGSCFHFCVRFPYGELKNESDGLEEEKRLDGMRILLAEDNELNAEIVMAYLDLQGAEADWEKDGESTCERFAASIPGEYQVILMDIRMPVLNGIEAAKIIRGMDREDAAKIPIIALTANSFKEDVDAAMAAGMNAFLNKPLDAKLLCQTVHKLTDAPH